MQHRHTFRWCITAASYNGTGFQVSGKQAMDRGRVNLYKNFICTVFMERKDIRAKRTSQQRLDWEICEVNHICAVV